MTENKKKYVKLRTVGIAIAESQVLIHQTAGNDYWSLPGGNIETHEDSRMALIREIKEETNRSILVNSLVWTTENFYTRPNGKLIHEIALYYTITFERPSLKNFTGVEGDHLLNFCWVERQSLTDYPLEPAFLIEALQKPLPHIPEHFIFHDNQITHRSDGLL